MTHKLSSDGAAVVAPNVKWIRIDERTPIGCRMQLVDKAQNIAFTRVHHKSDGFTHWFPVPTYDEDEK